MRCTRAHTFPRPCSATPFLCRAESSVSHLSGSSALAMARRLQSAEAVQAYAADDDFGWSSTAQLQQWRRRDTQMITSIRCILRTQGTAVEAQGYAHDPINMVHLALQVTAEEARACR